MTTLLDELSGYEFEDAVASLFRALGYEDVSVATRVADEGRDITMYDAGTACVVECKHTDTVSRPVVQKLHSAVATYPYDGPKRGMVVTSGRFTGPAEEYAERLQTKGDPHPIELLDGRGLRELGESVGMDLYNGRIEIVCEETLPVGDPERTLGDVFEDTPRHRFPNRLSTPRIARSSKSRQAHGRRSRRASASSIGSTVTITSSSKPTHRDRGSDRTI